MNIIERIKEYIDFKGISKYRFYQETGFSNGFLDKNSNIGSDKCERIIYQYTDVSPEWLLTGKGSMLREAVQPPCEPTSVPFDTMAMRLMDKLDEKDAENRHLQTELRLMEKELATLKAQHSQHDSQSDEIALAFPSDSLEGSTQDSLPMRKPATSSRKLSAGKM